MLPKEPQSEIETIKLFQALLYRWATLNPDILLRRVHEEGLWLFRGDEPELGQFMAFAFLQEQVVPGFGSMLDRIPPHLEPALMEAFGRWAFKTTQRRVADGSGPSPEDIDEAKEQVTAIMDRMKPGTPKAH